MSKISIVFFWFALAFAFFNLILAIKTADESPLKWLGVIIGCIAAAAILINEWR